MRTQLKAHNPGEIEFTLSTTMPAREWEALRDQLEKLGPVLPWPACDLRREINDLLSQARRTYFPTVPSEEKST